VNESGREDVRALRTSNPVDDPGRSARARAGERGSDSLGERSAHGQVAREPNAGRQGQRSGLTLGEGKCPTPSAK
jgi:hypothetical protein